jgi:23S rRNA (adenine2030-N6)-methyltransferase
VNYRHAFHAGNFADTMKHALLVWLMRALTAKPKPLFVLDTHAGIGRYDLTAEPARRTNEAAGGIEILLKGAAPPLDDYIKLVRQLGLYPGSPVLIQALLRPADRLACCEWHPEDVRVLRRAMAGDSRVHIHHRDGYEALGALLPPPERRALILIDPPFEAPDEFDRLAAALKAAQARFPQGVYAAWYPLKHRAPSRGFQETLRLAGLRDIVAAEFFRAEPTDPARLTGCGLVLLNPPYGFEAAATDILDALADRLAEPSGGFAVSRIADE